MRIRLSKKGWNNVLIFASMFMILLFNYSHKMFVDGQTSEAPQALLPQNSLVQSIDYSGVKLERIGSNWRVLTELQDVELTSASDYVTVWQQQPFTLLLAEPLMLDSARSLPVVVWVAGQASGWVYEFVIDAQEGTAYVKDHRQSLWYVVEPHLLSQLIPPSVLNF